MMMTTLAFHPAKSYLCRAAGSLGHVRKISVQAYCHASVHRSHMESEYCTYNMQVHHHDATWPREQAASESRKTS
jgi:hypothetical protein